MKGVLQPTDASLKALDEAVSELALVDAGVDIPRLENATRAGAGARDETA